jgi:hypothetical protein
MEWLGEAWDGIGLTLTPLCSLFDLVPGHNPIQYKRMAL